MRPTDRGYCPLWCKSNFSFLEGASHPEELVERAATLGLRHLALTDRDGVYGVVRAHVAAREAGLHLIVGAQISVDDGSQILLLARDHSGYSNLCRLISAGRLRSKKGESAVRWREVCAHADGLHALWGGPQSLLAAPAAPAAVLRQVREAFDGRLDALVTRQYQAREVALERRVRARARELALPVSAGVEVLYHVPERRPVQDVLTCLRAGVTLPEAGQIIRPNAEHFLRPPAELINLFADDLGAVTRTLQVAEQCSFSLSELRYRYPTERLPDGVSSIAQLRELALAGGRERFDGEVPERIARQVERELALIDELDYSGYFLTMWEIIQFCRRQGILCQGRGSAANSVVCYCLGITAVDPTKIDLLFERFISRERREPPDIDLDIAHQRREEVIQHVYDHYGRTHAAMVANLIRYRERSAIRDVGKALGLPATLLDQLAKLVDRHDGDWEPVLKHAHLDPEQPLYQHLMRLSTEIYGFPRHLSIHPGGFLLGHEPVSNIVPIENASMEGRTVIQWDKDDLEELALFKVDLLGLGALTVVNGCFELLREHRGIDLSLATLPPEDPATYAMCRRADTVGVFQIESRAQMAMLPRIKPRAFYDLVIQISIVRPGPITGGMVHPYLRRRNGEEPVIYPHPSLKPVLEKTLGVPLFQEQVMRLAVVAADYTPGEADQLRRDMAAWRHSGRIERHRDRLISRMEHKGVARRFAEQVFEQIRGFGEYGFPESHAASFALIAYATAWLKCHHPGIYTCAMLNAQPMGFYSPATLVQDVRHHGVEVRPVDVLNSGWDCTMEQAPAHPEPGSGSARPGASKQAPAHPEPGSGSARPGASKPALALRMGLRYVKGLAAADAARLLAERCRGPYRDLNDLVQRSGLGQRPLALLAEAGAFEGLRRSRRDALWEIPRLLKARADGLRVMVQEPLPGFAPLDALETIAWDYRASSHSPRGHPLGPLRQQLRARGLPDARTLAATPDGARINYMGLVLNRQRPSTAGGVVFMTLEDETGFVNLVLWPDVFKSNAILAKTSVFLGVTGAIQNQVGVVHLVVERLWAPRLRQPPPEAPSRDFR